MPSPFQNPKSPSQNPENSAAKNSPTKTSAGDNLPRTREVSCGCIIIHDGHVLLEKQLSADVNFWGFPKGHSEPGETFIETALRETREEVGLEVEITDPTPLTMNYHIPARNSDKTVYLFLARLNPDKDNTLKIQTAELESALWVPFTEAEDLLSFDLAKSLWRSLLPRLN
ncbi:NUDIX domain-containing protein [Candidatus Saccharibacteria bacterium]|nr:NUDIX domain-containing protein [Candidatus Saccharibacteria bacterium]